MDSYLNNKNQSNMNKLNEAADANWWTFFGNKEILGIGAVIGGLASLIKSLNNTIKARFRKCAKLLYTMQKDFGTSENGMDMKSVLPGVGSKITDFAARMFGIKSERNASAGAIGIRPFVDGYIKEIQEDFTFATNSFNAVHIAGQYTGKAESSDNAMYKTFAEALKNITLNEGYMALHEAISFSDGKFNITGADGNEKTVQVNKESTREVCYSIISMFCNKYFDMNSVAQKLGIDINSLGNVNPSNADKFKKLCQTMKEPVTSGSENKMYSRVQTRYTAMVDSYIKIARHVVSNFNKYTTKMVNDKSSKGMSEKDSNLLFTANEKLEAEINRQQDIYTSNFYRVLNAIITSDAYLKYIDFIIENVLPVFSSGNAGDADMVLDALPKINDYFVISQTGSENRVVLARILNVDNESQGNPTITFARVGEFKDPSALQSMKIGQGAAVEYDLKQYPTDKFDTSVYAKVRGGTSDKSGPDGDSVSLTYDKWLTLNPIPAVNVPTDDRDQADLGRTKLYMRTVKGKDGKDYDVYIYGISDKIPESTVVSAVSGNLSEADENNATVASAQTQASQQEIPTEDPQSDIIRLGVAAVLSGTKLTDNPQKNKLTCGYIKLDKMCSAKQLNDKLSSMGFKPSDGMLDVKTAIEAAVSSGKGSNIEKKVSSQGIDSIDQSLTAVTTRKPSDILKDNSNTTVDNILKYLNSIKPEDLTAQMSLNDGSKDIVFYTSEQAKENPNIIDTGVESKSNPGDTIKINLYPILTDDKMEIVVPAAEQTATDQTAVTTDQTQSNASESIIMEADDPAETLVTDTPQTPDTANSTQNTAQQNQQNQDQQQNTAANKPEEKPNIKYTVGIIMTVPYNNGAMITIFAKNNKNVITGAYMNIIDGMVKNKLIESVSLNIIDPKFDITYGEFTINESTAGMITVSRKISCSVPGKYFVISENAWGDGSVLDPVKYLTESMHKIIRTAGNYDGFTKIAKDSRSINFGTVSESCSYNTALPYNRYQMLTRGNPLYESTAIIKFNRSGNISKVYNLGVKRISK